MWKSEQTVVRGLGPTVEEKQPQSVDKCNQHLCLNHLWDNVKTKAFEQGTFLFGHFEIMERFKS